MYARILNKLEVDDFNESDVIARGENHDQGHQGQVVAVTLITAKARVTPTKTESGLVCTTETNAYLLSIVFASLRK